MTRRIVFALLALGAAGCNKSSTAPSDVPQPPAANSAINYMAISASDGTGYGSSVPCLPFVDCPNGTGYIQVAARTLQAKGFTVNLTNPAIPTGTVGKDFQDLGNSNGHFILGNFIEQEAPFTPSNTTLVTIFGGANDVTVVTGALGKGAGASDQRGYINSQIANFKTDFTTLLSIVRGRAPSARIVVLNLPNMAGMPMFAGSTAQEKQALQLLSVGFTTQVLNPLTSQGILVIDMMCDPRSYQAATYSSDGFHPSDQGYAWMAAEVVAAATTAYKAPQASCTPMTLVAS